MDQAVSFTSTHLSAAQTPHHTTNVVDDPEAPTSKTDGAHLDRWSRARSIRLAIQRGRASFRQNDNSAAVALDMEPELDEDEVIVAPSSSLEGDVIVGTNGNAGLISRAPGKPIYLVSDGTGWTLEHSVSATLRQFESCLADQSCAVNTHLFSGIQDTDRLMEVVKQAARVGALILYTLSDPPMAESAKRACKMWGVPAADVLQPTTDAIAAHLGVSPSGIPRGAHVRKSLITAEYFRRIEAYDFSMKQDDGAQPQNLDRAHIVLVGVSRTGKTPLSIYLAQKGYKVANVPVVMDVDLPRTLFEINQDKVFGLTINCVVLQRIRKARTRDLGFDAGMSNYSDLDAVREELDYANKIFSQNPSWPVIDVTGKAIEETAAVVVRLYLERKQKCSTPRISRWY